MADPFLLPVAIPGMLRRGSPGVVDSDTLGRLRVAVHEIRGGRVSFSADGHERVMIASAKDVALDLTDPTGRAHAAWWLVAEIDALCGDQYRPARAVTTVIKLACSGADMTQDQIATLIDVCLHVAGVDVDRG